MKKLVLGLALMAFATIGFSATTPQIVPPGNGDDWLKLTSTEKLFWSVGYAQGYQDALGKIDVASGPNTPCQNLANRTERTTSTAGKVSGIELVSGLEKFYSDPANVNIPLGSAIRIYLLQQTGKDPVAIQELIETARVLGAQARTAAK